MSKKKASGSTMTLKDFHGGSIPSDLPLPSAPGVVVRPSDRSGFDRSSSWINPTGRSDHRSRPHTSPATRHFDDKAPFLSHTAHIGRNFDEDERKPLDGVSAPRRTISDESIRAIPTRAELKPESSPSGGFRGRQGWTPASLSPSGSVNSYAGRVNEANHGGLNSLNLDGNVGQGVAGAYPNAWAARKEAAGVAADQLQSAWSAPNAVSKLAHASALEKVSSGRWQSKHSGHYQADVEVMRSSETESGLHTKSYANSTYNRLEVTGGREYYDATLSRHAERGLTIDGNIQGVRKELPDYERARAPASSELKERDLTNFNDRRQPDHADGKFGGPESPSSTLSESLARPKLKLLPRTKLVESLESPVVDQAQAYQQASESGRTEHFNDLYGNLSPAKSGTSSTENEKQAVERPKLNLKPRSQPLEQLEGKVERDRNTVFGGARPRELVLKERGIDDVGITHDLVQHSEKVEHHSPRTERVPGHANASRHSEKTENHHLDQRIGKKTERRDHRVDVDKVDMQKRNWRNENRRTHRDTERQQHQQPDRPPSPETWRKPIEQPKPSSADGASLRHGKAASAVELAQAFSRSVSDSNMDRFSGQKGIPGGGQLPFSRLMGTTSRPQINGY